MSNADELSIASMTTLSIPESPYVFPDSGHNQLLGPDPTKTEPSTPEKVIMSRPKPEMLTMVFVTTKNGETKEKYTTVPLPDTYDAAVTSAIKTLGMYMSDPTPNNILLCSSTKNRKDEWVWANIPPENWTTTLELNRTEIGVFERREKVLLPEVSFISGSVLITTGKKNSKGTQVEWTRVSRLLMRPAVARPKTFSEAFDTLNKYLQTKSDYDPRLKDKNQVRFYIVENNLAVWIAIPLIAHSDDDRWRFLVPKPGNILGAMVE